MKVAVLSQYLKALLEPLRASRASAVSDIERICELLDDNRDEELTSFAEFLSRAKVYEAQGNWPDSKSHRTAKASNKQKKNVSDDTISDCARRLLAANTPDAIRTELRTVSDLNFNRDHVRKLIACLGAKLKCASASEGLKKIEDFLLQDRDSPTAPQQSVIPAPSSKLTRIVETMRALKAKADGADAPFDEIEAELTSIEQELDAREAIAAAKELGVVRTLSSRQDAIEAIRKKVLEMKYVNESIAY